jgi:NAD+ diphosphatase
MTKTFADKKFCTWCGGKLRKIDDNCFRCETCNVSDYHNPKPTALAIVRNELGELLCTVRALDPGKGMLDMPGGFVDAGETAQEALARELKEELGISVKAKDLTYLFSYSPTYEFEDITYSIFDTAFGLELPKSTPLKPADDVVSATWMAIKDVDFDDIWSPEMAAALKQYFAN